MLERWRPQHLLLTDAGLWDGAVLHADFPAWCSARVGQRCRLWLSSACVVELLCEPGLPLADDAAALTWARGVLQHYHGESASGWPLAAWQQGAVRGVSALHGLHLDALQGSARRHGVRILAASPWWSLVLARALQRHKALQQGLCRLLVVEGTRVMSLDLDQGRVTHLALRRIDKAEPGELGLLAAPTGTTAAVGYGLAAGAVAGVQTLHPLQALNAPAEWLAAQGVQA